MTELRSGRGSVDVNLGGLFTARAHYLTFRARSTDPLHVVEMSGELDLASRDAAIHACSLVEHLNVLVDLSGLIFMDCTGYGALAASTMILERRGGSLVLMNPVGEPRRMLELIEELELGLCAPLRYETLSASCAATIPSMVPMKSDLGCGAGRLGHRRDTIDRWTAAISRGDDAEADRLVRQSRVDRAWIAASGQLGALLGQTGSTASTGFGRTEPPSSRAHA